MSKRLEITYVEDCKLYLLTDSNQVKVWDIPTCKLIKNTDNCCKKYTSYTRKSF